MVTHSQLTSMEVKTTTHLNREATENEHILAEDRQEHVPKEYQSNHESGKRRLGQGQNMQYQQEMSPQMQKNSENGGKSRTQQNHCSCQDPGKSCDHHAVRILSKQVL